MVLVLNFNFHIIITDSKFPFFPLNSYKHGLLSSSRLISHCHKQFKFIILLQTSAYLSTIAIFFSLLSTLFSYLTSAVTVAAAANDSIVSFTRSAFTYANLFIAGAITGVLVGGFSLAEEVLSICIIERLD